MEMNLVQNANGFASSPVNGKRRTSGNSIIGEIIRLCHFLDFLKVERNSPLLRRTKIPLSTSDMKIPKTPPEDIKRLVQELHTYQIDLEMQNEELRKA